MDDVRAVVPLFEKVGDPGIPALTVDVSNPAGAHLPTLPQTCLFTTGDDPLDGAVQIRTEVNWSKQWLCRDPAEGGRDGLERVQSVQ